MSSIITPLTQTMPSLQPYLIGRGQLEKSENGMRFLLDGASAEAYSDSQLDDFHGRSREQFLWQPPVSLSLRARFSHQQALLRGTAGFGWWNVPFKGDQVSKINLGPQVLWFFFGSPPSNLATAAGWSGNGWFAQSLNVPTLPNWFVRLGMLALRLPFIKRLTHHAAEAATRSSEQPLDKLDITAWHDYRLEWHKSYACCYVDQVCILQTKRPPQAPLALVFWMDNQWATLQGGSGLLDVPQKQWMELADVRISKGKAT